MPTQSLLPPNTARTYQIAVEGLITEDWSGWLNGMALDIQQDASGMPLTCLSGVLSDQVALRGLLNRLWDLNLVLRSVTQIDPAPISQI
jgi:hypothetical protein